MPTKRCYNDIVNGHTGVLYQSQRVVALSERPHTHLMLLALQPVLVEMTSGTMSRQLSRRIMIVKQRTSHKLRIYICDSGERWLITNSNEQRGTTEIDPAVDSGVARN